MKPLLSLFIAITILFSLESVFAEKSTEIYKWTDKDGRVHYAARPGDKTAQKMHLGSHRFKNTNTKQEIEDKKAKERAATCKASKSTLAIYEKAPFLYRYDEEKKQKVRLSDEEGEEAMLQARKDVNYWCGNTEDDQEQELTQNDTQ